MRAALLLAAALLVDGNVGAAEAPAPARQACVAGLERARWPLNLSREEARRRRQAGIARNAYRGRPLLALDGRAPVLMRRGLVIREVIFNKMAAGALNLRVRYVRARLTAAGRRWLAANPERRRSACPGQQRRVMTQRMRSLVLHLRLFTSGTILSCNSVAAELAGVGR